MSREQASVGEDNAHEALLIKGMSKMHIRLRSKELA